MFRSLLRAILPNPFDRIVQRAKKQGQRRFLFVWNRGLGDVALGLFAIIYRIRQIIPDASISFLVRESLVEGFSMLPSIDAFPAHVRRGEPVDVEKALSALGRSKKQWDVIIEKPDPTQWVRWQLGVLTPKLHFPSAWQFLYEDFHLSSEKIYIGIHLQTETQYGYEKNWPLRSFMFLIDQLTRKYNKKVILFGAGRGQEIDLENVVDLRGNTSLGQMLSVIKNCCSHLIAPDSGVLSITYYIDQIFSLHVVSLWADPRQGVLKQNVASPNKSLYHVPLIAKEGNLSNISVEEVIDALGFK